ncbi:unnamed protein product [Allacma fusca]|uniref:Very long-chain specific acyl-CoA dehydrogenase, mitochondrial n=1 Tax=Allacma fusca TaxID=39272 RepID=A0A8J2NTL6_9HEXA|nr:unnamed protein product [Allacma fusca]
MLMFVVLRNMTLIRNYCLLGNPVLEFGRHGCFFSTNRTLLNPTLKAPPPSKSFLANIFRGKIITEQIFPYPDVLSKEQRETLELIVPAVEKFFNDDYDALKFEADDKVPDETLQILKDLGTFGMQVPEEYNGVGFNNSQYARLAETLGKYDLGVAITLGAHQSIGFKGILLYGNPEQKKKYLPKLATGENVAAFALTEPASGSDAGSIRTKATLSPDGKYWVLNGNKIWISNGGFAEIFTVFAQTEVEDKKKGGKKSAITAFIVERSFGGVSNSAPENKMGIRCSNTVQVYFDNCKVPAENVLGNVGEGFKVAMNILNSGRFGMGAGLSGTMRTSIAKATEFAVNRKQFGETINNFGAIQEKIARMAILHYVTESVAYVVAGVMDNGYKDFQIEAAVSKVFASEAAWNVTDEAIQIMGGMGYMRETGLEKILRDIRIHRIFEGTNDILRLFIALQGIQHAGAKLKELQIAMKHPAANLGLVLREARKRVIKSDDGELKSCVHPDLASEAVLTSECIHLFSKTVEQVLMKYKKGIVKEQFVLKRIADSAIDIFSMAVVLSRTTQTLQRKYSTAVHETLMAKAWCQEASERVRTNLSKADGANNIKFYENLSTISANVCSEKGVVQPNPLRVTVHGMDKKNFERKLTNTVPITSYVIRGKKWGKFSNKNCYPKSDPKQKQFLSDILDLVAIAGLPLNIVEHPAFMNFVRNMDKMVSIPSRRTLGRALKSESSKVYF